MIAATNKNLAELVANGKFREDLFYRLNVVGLEMPPLRDRRSDIPALAKFFLDRFVKENAKPIDGFTTEPALPFFLERYAAAYRLELADFLAALRGATVQLATGMDGLRALALADAAQRSHDSGQPVSLN